MAEETAASTEMSATQSRLPQHQQSPPQIPSEVTTTASTTTPPSTTAGTTTPAAVHGDPSADVVVELEDEHGSSSSEEEEPPDDGPSLWRLNPHVSYSDWRLEIISIPNVKVVFADSNNKNNKEGDNDKTITFVKMNEEGDDDDDVDDVPSTCYYNVHRGRLSAGSRRCEYFATLFQTELKRMESGDDNITDIPTASGRKSNCTTKIELPDIVAEAIPSLLEYLYKPNDVIPSTSETATALHFLGTFFQNPQLKWDALKFCKKDIKLENCHIYYDHALQLADAKVLDAVVTACARSFEKIESSCEIFSVADPLFWQRVLDKLNELLRATKTPMSPKLSRHAGLVITEICTLHMDMMTVEQFDLLTDPKYLPQMDGIVASTLLEIHDYFRDTLPPNQQRQQKQKQNQLTNLQERCVEALGQDWVQLARAENKKEFLRRLKPDVTAALLQNVLKKANVTVKEDKQIIERMRKGGSRQSDVQKSRG